MMHLLKKPKVHCPYQSALNSTLSTTSIVRQQTVEITRNCVKMDGTSHNHLDWPRLSYREQFKVGDEEADRGNDGKTASKSGLVLNRISFYM